jgi:hypothetical protein
MQQIYEDNQIHLNRFKQSPPHASYIAGFIDGDGCIFIRKIADGYQSGFSITQCRTNILQVIRYHFGGSITTSTKRNSNTTNIMNNDGHYHKFNTRNQYNLLIRNNEYQTLLDYLQSSFIIKEMQYQCLQEFNKFANLTNKGEEKDKMHVTCTECNLKCHINEANLLKLNGEYISGLFDAEGCIYINKQKYTKFYISITQKNHPLILHEIVQHLGFGSIDGEQKFKIYKKSDCLQFIRLIKNHLIVKYNQAIAFETFVETNDTNIKDQMYAICNKEKHEIEHFVDLNQNENGKEGYLESVKLKKIKEQICKQIRNNQVYKEKSDKMKGEGNHNFGKAFSEETRKKMSVSIRDAKGGISDEIILQVRQMIQDGYKNVEIQSQLELNKHTITRIKNGELVCRHETKKEKVSLTQEQVNLSKRKINVDDILIVLEKLVIKQLKPTVILHYFIEQNKLNVSIDMIKNIKRYLTNGKTIIYESELSTERYEYYQTLITQFAEKSA